MRYVRIWLVLLSVVLLPVGLAAGWLNPAIAADG